MNPLILIFLCSKSQVLPEGLPQAQKELSCLTLEFGAQKTNTHAQPRA